MVMHLYSTDGVYKPFFERPTTNDVPQLVPAASSRATDGRVPSFPAVAGDVVAPDSTVIAPACNAALGPAPTVGTVRVDPDLALVVSTYGSSAPVDAAGRGPALTVASAVVTHVAPASAVVVPLAAAGLAAIVAPAAPIPAPIVAPAAPIHAPVMPPAVEAADLGTNIEGPVAAPPPPGFLPVQLNELPISQHNVHGMFTVVFILFVAVHIFAWPFVYITDINCIMLFFVHICMHSSCSSSWNEV